MKMRVLAIVTTVALIVVSVVYLVNRRAWVQEVKKLTAKNESLHRWGLHQENRANAFKQAVIELNITVERLNEELDRQ